MNKGEIPWHLPCNIGLWRGGDSECNQGNLGDGEETGEEVGSSRGIRCTAPFRSSRNGKIVLSTTRQVTVSLAGVTVREQEALQCLLDLPIDRCDESTIIFNSKDAN